MKNEELINNLFFLCVNEKMAKYLKKKAIEGKYTIGDYVRKLINKEMENENEGRSDWKEEK